MLESLLIRADAGRRMGAGHVMRCLALAQAWQDAGGAVEFLSFSMPPQLATRLASEGMIVRELGATPGSDTDAEATVAVARSIGSRWIVVDGYQFCPAFQWRVKDSGFKLLFVDDYGHCDFYCADLVLNQNLYAHAGFYARRENYTRLVLGTRYALLRREFKAWAEFHRETPKVARKLLVTFGGADPDNVACKVLDALSALHKLQLEIRIVVGSANGRLQMQSAAAAGLQFITEANMPELMAWAEMAISGAGSTCLELLFMQVPAAVLIMAENQRQVAEELQRRSLSSNMGRGRQISSERITDVVSQLLTSAKRRKQVSEHGRKLVDGEGAFRVVRVMCDLTGCAIVPRVPISAMRS